MRSCNRNVRSVVLAAAAATISLFQGRASATDFTWVPTAGGAYDWNLATNWNPAGPPNTNGDSANLSIAMTGDQSIGLAASSTVGTITIGSSGSPVITDIVNTGGTGLLIINGSTGTASIVSTGVAGVTNRFSVPIQLQSNLEIDATSTQPLSITGGISAFGGNRVLNNRSSSTLTLGALPIADVTDTSGRTLTINDHDTGGGDVLLGGVISDGAAFASGMNIGRSANALTPYTRVVITGNNTYTGNTSIRRAVVVVGSDTAFGATGLLTLTGATGQVMAILESDNDARTIGTAAGTRYNQFAVIRGDHSLTFTTKVAQGNNRSLTNALAPGKTLTFNSDIYAATDNTNRTWVFEGPGRTIVNGSLLLCDNSQGTYAGAIMSYEKRGTGTVTVNGAASDYNGGTRVRSGLLEFASIAGMGSTSGATVEAGGAMGLLTGSTDPNFIAKIATGGGAGPSQDPTTSRGALALAPADAAATLDFVAGNMSAANTLNMGVGAVSSGVTYTGTIVPANSTYKLGGGGDLTMPGTNQLTGGNGVTADNGGKVIITGSNNYTGVTKISGNYTNPTQELIAANVGTNLLANPFSLRINSTLSTNLLANGGASSGIGASGNAAANLVIDGGTFQYTGPAASTDRLFTIGANGATLDASGAGAVTFTNSGNIVSADAPNGRTGTLENRAAGTINFGVIYLDNVADLAPGMTISGNGVDADTTITALMSPSFGNIGNTGGNGPYQIILSKAGTAGVAGPLSFGNQNRTLRLTGSSSADNNVRGVLSDSVTGKLSVAKSGAGKWILSGNNTYTGGTTVSAGTLELSTRIPAGPTSVTGGTLKVGQKGTANSAAGTSVLTSLTIGAGTVDLTNNSLVLDYTGPGPNNSLRDQVRTWLQGGQLLTSASTPAGTRLGYADNAALATPFTTFSGVSVDADSILVKFTYAGDSNLDGQVDITDLAALATAWQTSGVWVNGDFDYNGFIDITDLAALATNWQAGVGAPLAMSFEQALASVGLTGVSVVPEPATIALLSLGAISLLSRKRRT